MKENPLQWMGSEEMREVMDRLLGDFMSTCIGKNDMAVHNALLSSAAILLVAHCERTGQNYAELANESTKFYGMALEIAGDKYD